MSAELRLDHVVVRHDGLLVLHGVTLCAAPGEVVALVGPSGCGKSTLLDVAAGLRTADAGEVTLDGAPIATRVGRVALMPQGDSLMPWRTLLGNVAVGAALAGLDEAEARRHAQRVIARFGLDGFQDHYPHALSGGMRQRVALARTVLAAKPVWLLDEPFGALDALTRADLRDDLLRAWAQDGPTVLLVTHDTEEAAVLADRILVCGGRPMGALTQVTVPDARPRDPMRVAAIRLQVMDALHAAGARA